MRSPKRPFANQDGPVLLAHRGFSGHYPENTLLAFAKAAEYPIDGLEMDIYATRDDVLVVSHDDSVARMTNGEGRIQSYTLAELQTLDAGYQFTPDNGRTYPFRGQGLQIPTLESVFEQFPDLWINVDIKQHQPRVVDLFRQLIRRFNAARQLCVGSFSSQTVEQFRAACPDVVTSATRREIGTLYALSRLHLETFYSGEHPMQLPPQKKKWGLTIDFTADRFLAAAHQQKTAVHLWTINDQDEMRRHLAAGVDGIITNFPDRATAVLRRPLTTRVESG